MEGARANARKAGALVYQKLFQHAATAANPGGLRQHTTHSDHRRFTVPLSMTKR